MSITAKPNFFIDNDLLNNIFGRGTNYNAQFGINYLNQLAGNYNIVVTDVIRAEIIANPNYGGDNGVFDKWMTGNNITAVETSIVLGSGNAGERSIIEAINSQEFSGQPYKIGSDDTSYFNPSGEGSQYLDKVSRIQDTSNELLRTGDLNVNDYNKIATDSAAINSSKSYVTKWFTPPQAFNETPFALANGQVADASGMITDTETGTKYPLHIGLDYLNKLGTAGDVLAVTIAVFRANDAYAAGDKAGATHIMEEWAAEFVGGIGGGVAGVKAALGIIGVISLASPPGVVISGILVLAGALGGGYYGGELAKIILEKGIELELYTQQMVTEFVNEVRDWWAELSDSIDGLSDSISAAYWKFLDALAASLIDPLIIDTAGNGIKLDSWQTSTVLFDLDGNGTKENTGWTKANGDDAFLVIDKNNDGKINDITEMFGNRDVPGFKQLATYDSNKDGLINATDTQFNLLKLWNDKNANGVVDSGELTTLAANGIKEISLSKYNSTANISGNMQTSISSVTKTDGTTRNIHELNFGFESLTPILATNRDATLPSTFQLNIETIVMPYSRGYGSLYSWQAAMTLDSTLLNMAQDISQITPANDNLAVEKQLVYAIN
jgi:hypothetical protein